MVTEVWKVVVDRSRLVAQLEATLTRLGLERKAKPLPVFEEYATRREAQMQVEEPASDDDATKPPSRNT